jgi:hypothetical protein
MHVSAREALQNTCNEMCDTFSYSPLGTRSERKLFTNMLLGLPPYLEAAVPFNWLAVQSGRISGARESDDRVTMELDGGACIKKTQKSRT